MSRGCIIVVYRLLVWFKAGQFPAKDFELFMAAGVFLSPMKGFVNRQAYL